ncbi:MAG: shikimate dehydrogenase [Acidimicrobiales bacterium]
MIGDPVSHSLSPLIHNAAFVALELDWVYTAFDVAPTDLTAAIRGAEALGVEGLSVTMPHKEAVTKLVDSVSATVDRLGAANTLHRVGKGFRAENTDGDGLIDALRLDEGFDPADRVCAVIGAGGAGRAVCLALGEAGAKEVVVVNRSAGPAGAAAALAGRQGRVGTTDEIAGADLIVNCTPLGMAGVAPDAIPVPAECLSPGQMVVDLVYHPVHTPLLLAAKERGAIPVTGVGMLIHQAGRAFRLWTGENAPLGAMSAAVVAVLSSGEVKPR